MIANQWRQEAFYFPPMNSAVSSTYFATLETLICEKNLYAKRIFNLDESGITPQLDIHGIASGKSSCKTLVFRTREC